MSSFIYNNDIPACSAPVMVCHICYETGIKLSGRALHAITSHAGGFTPGVQETHDEFQPRVAVLHAADLHSAIGQNGAK